MNGFTPTSAQWWELNSTSITSEVVDINGVQANAGNTLPDIPGRDVLVSGTAINVTLPAHSVNSFVLTGTFD